MVSTKGVVHGWLKMTSVIVREKPLRATYHLLRRELSCVESFPSHIFRQQFRPPWDVFLGLSNAEILHLVGLCPAPARDDHSNPQVWWSFPPQDIQNSHHNLLRCFPTCCQEDAMTCSIHNTKAICCPNPALCQDASYWGWNHESVLTFV